MFLGIGFAFMVYGIFNGIEALMDETSYFWSAVYIGAGAWIFFTEIFDNLQALHKEREQRTASRQTDEA